MHGFERRYSDRLPVAGAKIEYKQNDGSSDTTELLDLTKSSVRFETADTIEIGEFIDLGIIVPNEEKINIKGTVIRNSNGNEKIKPYTVIKFSLSEATKIIILYKHWIKLNHY